MGTRQREMKELKGEPITITANPDGSVSVEPYYARVGRQPVRWVEPNGKPWAVAFLGHRSPFKDAAGNDILVVHGNGGLMAPGNLVASREGHFQYSVAVTGPGGTFLPDHDTIYLDVACPEMIVP